MGYKIYRIPPSPPFTQNTLVVYGKCLKIELSQANFTRYNKWILCNRIRLIIYCVIFGPWLGGEGSQHRLKVLFFVRYAKFFSDVFSMLIDGCRRDVQKISDFF